MFLAGLLSISGTFLRSQDSPSQLTPEAAQKLLTAGEGIWLLQSESGHTIPGDCAGKFSLQFKPNGDAEEVGCLEGGLFSTTQSWKVSKGPAGKTVLQLGNETIAMTIQDENGISMHAHRLLLTRLDVLDPKSGKKLLHIYRSK
jgi:hypothetical protein